MDLVGIEGHDRLAKDCQSGAVINLDSSGLEAAKQAKARALAEKNRLDTIEHKVEHIESTLNRILEILEKR